MSKGAGGYYLWPPKLVYQYKSECSTWPLGAHQHSFERNSLDLCETWRGAFLTVK